MNDSICQEMHALPSACSAELLCQQPSCKPASPSESRNVFWLPTWPPSELPITAVADFGLEGSVSHETTPSLNTRLNRSCARDHEADKKHKASRTTEGTDALWLKAIKWMLD